ncbi:MAG: hypothetical protein O3B42_06565 [Actinomycetota bacterium]|nr:hypothetical protein [Actinomycetota bacterium]
MTTKRPRTSARTAFAVLIGLGVAAALAVVIVILGDDDDTSVAAAGEVSWLYSQTADGGELDDLGDGNYRLIMRGVDPHTIQFSDRPHRLVEIIDTARLVHHWEELFADSAPNAVLVEHEASGETDSLVVVLTNPVYDSAAGTLSYDAQLLADELHPERLLSLVDSQMRPPVMMRSISLFIDSVQDAGSGSMVDPATIAGAGAQHLLDLLAGADLGGGVHLESATVDVADDGSVTGSAVVTFDTSGFGLSVQLSMTDAQNWSLTAAPVTSSTWMPANLPSLTIDPSSFSGTVSMTDGAISYDLVGSTHTWNMANGVTYVSTPEFSAECPLDESQCPVGLDGPYLSMNGSLSVAGIPNTLALTGAITTDGDWARFDGDAGNVTLGGFGITDATLTVWHGQRSDSFDPNMEMPSLGTLNSGVDLEFCGGFVLPIPGHSNAATNGCARWSTAGIVLGQVGVDLSMSGSMPSAGSVAIGSADVKGVAWTNIAADVLGQLPTADVIMSGVHDALASNTFTLAGKASLPGVAAEALNIDLGGATTYVFDVSGSISAKGFSLSAVLPTNIHIGSEPFRADITSITATIAAESGKGASFSVGTSGVATVGYSPNTRQITTSVQLVAAVAPQPGMVLSVNATGTKAANDTGGDGLTSATRLSNPAGAQYVWPDQFGIKGMNLWSMTVQIAYQDGLPALGYSSTTYLDPSGAQIGKVITCQGACDSADWMVGTLGFDVSLTNPCFAYSFDSGSGTSGFSIDNGTITATSFAVGIAPAGCSIQSGTTQQSLPTGFAGFKFTARFGSATLDVATQVSTSGFVFQASISDLRIAGMTYETVALSITINASGSNVDFTAVMTSGMGDMSVTSGFSASSSGVKQSLDATLTDWDWSSANVDIKTLHFATSATIPNTTSGCASFAASADGNVRIAGSTVTLEKGSSIAVDCNGVKTLSFDLTYVHTASTGSKLSEHIVLKYPIMSKDGKPTFYGMTEFSYERHFSKKYKNRTFSKNVTISIGMSITVNPNKPSSSGFEFWGDFDADRVSGAVDCELPADSKDFDCSGELRLNPSWAGVYRSTWSGL